MPYDNGTYVEVEAPAPAELTPRQKLFALRDRLRDIGPANFDMANPTECVSGHARRMFRMGWIDYWPGERNDTARALGLSFDEGCELFSVHRDSRRRGPAAAAKVIDHYLATGDMDWGIAKWWRTGRKAVA